MSAVNEFMSKNKPLRKSKLSDYQYDIKMLLNNRYTVAQIHKFLVSEKVEVSRDYLYRYCQKIRDTTDASISAPVRTAAKPEPQAKVTPALTVSKAELKNEIPVRIKEPKVETKEDILSSIGAALKKRKEEFNGRANVEDWAPAS